MVFDYTKQNPQCKSKIRACKCCDSFCKGAAAALRSRAHSTRVAKEEKGTEADCVSASQQTAFKQYGNKIISRVALGFLHITWLQASIYLFITIAVLIYKWSLGTGYHKNKLYQNYVLEINTSHGTKWTWENSFVACLLKYIHQAYHCLLFILTGEVLFLLQYLSLVAMKNWGWLLTCARTTLPYFGPAKTPRGGTCVLHTTRVQWSGLGRLSA